jgi:hypothetical protein
MSDTYGFTPPEEPKKIEQAEPIPVEPVEEEPINENAAAEDIARKRFLDSWRDERGVVPMPLRGGDWREHIAPARHPDAEEAPETMDQWRTRILNGGGRGPKFLAWRDDTAKKEPNLGNTWRPGSTFGRSDEQ